MEAISEQRLAEGSPVLATRVRAAHDAMVLATGNGFRVAQCLRSYEESDADYAKGRTVPGPIVTNAPAGRSWHNFGLAVDCYPFTSGDAGALDWNAQSAEFEVMVSHMKAQGLAWGGDWHSIKDYPHFQLAELPDSPGDNDRLALTTLGLGSVWNIYSAG